MFNIPDGNLSIGSLITIHGDSMSAEGIIENKIPWPRKLCLAMGLGYNNRATGGLQLGNCLSFSILLKKIQEGDINIIQPFQNDVRVHGDDAGALSQNEKMLRAALIYLASTYESNIFLSSSNSEFTNVEVTSKVGWIDLPPSFFPTNQIGSLVTVTNASELVIDFQGTALYVIGYNYANSSFDVNGGTLAIDIDGIDYGVVNDFDVGVALANEGVTFPECIRIGGLSPGKHTATLTAGITGDERLDILNVFSNGKAAVDKPPVVFVGQPLRFTDVAYTTNPPFDQGSAESNLLYDRIVKKIVSELVEDGYSVSYIPTDIYNPDITGILAPDGLHCLQAGDDLILKAYLSVFNFISKPEDKQRANFKEVIGNAGIPLVLSGNFSAPSNPQPGMVWIELDSGDIYLRAMKADRSIVEVALA